MRNISWVLLPIIMTGFLTSASALEGESIVFNPKTGNYLITYLNSSDNAFRQVTFIPATKIKPTLISKFKLEQDGANHYEYTLFSGWNSQQVIRHLTLDKVSSVVTQLSHIPTLNARVETEMGDLINKAKILDTPPAPWETSMNYSDGGQLYRFGLWYRHITGGLTPGSKVTFGLRSLDLPGIIQAEIHGYAPGSKKLPGDTDLDAEDGGFGQKYTEIVHKRNFVPRFATVPTIAVPTPFNAAVLLESIQTQMHTWIAMQLLDATFSSQLDRYLISAANAYRLNQPKAGKEFIQTLRKMLKKEHEDADRDDDKEDGKHEDKSDDKAKGKQIDRLAARVLDFDLKYVLKRMGGDKDD